MLYYGLSYFCLEYIGVDRSSCIPPYILPLEWIGALLALVSLIVLVFTFRRPKTRGRGTSRRREWGNLT